MKEKEKDTTTLQQKLATVRQRLHVGKNNVNNHLRSKYRTTADILKEVKPLLKENSLTMTISDTMTECGGRIYVKATVTVYDLDGTEAEECTAFAREDENRPGVSQSQCTGAASTYARKYALSGLFLIDDSEDDPDTDRNSVTYECNDASALIARVQKATTLTELTQLYTANVGLMTPEVRQLFTTRKSEIR